ncbi:unnamed protein product [Cunninghamella echinulata]
MSQPSKRARISQSVNEIQQEFSSQLTSQDISGDHSHEEMERKAKELVRYALACEFKKIIIRKEDINKKILQGYSRQFKRVFTIAQTILYDIFGMALIEIPAKERMKPVSASAAISSQNPSEAITKLPSSNTYILCNALNQHVDASSVIHYTETEYANMGLLYLILSLIFVNERIISEGDLKKYLNKVGVPSTSNTFGDLEKLISTYTKQGYLYRVKRTENTANNEPEWDYQWGPRAKVELQYKDLCKFIASFYEVDDMNEFQKNIFKAASIE